LALAHKGGDQFSPLLPIKWAGSTCDGICPQIKLHPGPRLNLGLPAYQCSAITTTPPAKPLFSWSGLLYMQDAIGAGDNFEQLTTRISKIGLSSDLNDSIFQLYKRMKLPNHPLIFPYLLISLNFPSFPEIYLINSIP